MRLGGRLQQLVDWELTWPAAWDVGLGLRLLLRLPESITWRRLRSSLAPHCWHRQHMWRVRSAIDIDLFCTFLANFAPPSLTYLGLCNTLLIWTKIHFSQFNAHLATCCRHGRLQCGTCLLPAKSRLRADTATQRHTHMRTRIRTHTLSAHLSLHLSREGQRDFIFLSP